LPSLLHQTAEGVIGDRSARAIPKTLLRTPFTEL